MSKWVKVDDNAVRHIWKCKCGCHKKKVVISPTFYEENGTPICECGQDLRYASTEIIVPRSVHE